jgi:hypothetical protein
MTFLNFRRVNLAFVRLQGYNVYNALERMNDWLVKHKRVTCCIFSDDDLTINSNSYKLLVNQGVRVNP